MPFHPVRPCIAYLIACLTFCWSEFPFPRWWTTCRYEDFYDPSSSWFILNWSFGFNLFCSGCRWLSWKVQARGHLGVSHLYPVKCIWTFSVNKSKYFSNCSLSASTWDWKNQAVLWCFIDSNTNDINWIWLTWLLRGKQCPVFCKMLRTQLKTTWKHHLNSSS